MRMLTQMCFPLSLQYEVAATELKNESIKLAKVDCTEEQDICSEHGVEGYPTLKVFRKGTPTEYTGPRKSDGIINYMRKQALPAVSIVTAENVTEFSKKDKIVAIAYVTSPSEAETFHKLADEHRDSFLFGLSTDSGAAAKTGATVPSIVLYRTFDEPEVVYPGKADSLDELTSFLKAQSVPIIDEVGPENFMTYAEAGLPLAYYFTKPDYAGKDKDLEALKPLAKELKGKVNFVWIDAEKFVNHAKTLNIQSEDWPAFAIQDIHAQTKYPLAKTGKDLIKAVPDFVKDFTAGKLTPSIKSDPTPKTQDGPVHVLVADEFDKVVFDDKKDVLVEFYAPWCGHCKKLAPTYDTLGEKYKAHKDKIVIAKMDATTNDIPPSAGFQVGSFPTIKFKPAGGKEWIDFNGERTLDGFVEFIGLNAKNTIDVKLDSANTTGADEAAAAADPKPAHAHDEL
ncbi:protein disulfide isomerase [Tilletiaria anomala UBC 951]|uniref:Protein disulfide-isomerase n=1 Tax=Tilletiaria anomala (strain ATCC 24038 / CBS 436.72 / UBC 951) TaxID=1037660 RepID=A0A066W3C3_TILAU|nr:protein disulfide isomerase [Tilletiaria anomala UBC 951]KDN45589.1 protein disulfide isomerase [Tilletiaria anomala UBC 951]